MAKELPYFRFTPSEWQNGNISLEDYENQGFFIQVCCYYWICDCTITKEMLDKKFRHESDKIKYLIANNFIKVEKKTDIINIVFLNEQFDLLSQKRVKRQIAGSLGGKQKCSNAKAMLKQNCSYKDNNKDKDKDKDNKEESCFLFSDFWAVYPTKQNRAEAEKKFNRLSENDKMLIKNSINKFVENKLFKDYHHPMAVTYINQKRWLDVIEDNQESFNFENKPISGAIKLTYK